MPAASPIRAELVAVLAAVTRGAPRVLTTHGGKALPAGPFADGHRSLQTGLRAWVQAQTRHPLGYVEQLYTFADPGRTDRSGARVISVSYLALTRELRAPCGSEESAVPAENKDAVWRDWYHYFPWEDWRDGPPPSLDDLQSALHDWAAAARREACQSRRQRLEYLFPDDSSQWNADLILQRYELLYEAGLVQEARRGSDHEPTHATGEAMLHDHRRILATGIARLRAKIRYRPVIFELLPPTFTLLQLQQTFEALTGQRLHKQNFRRLITQQDLLEDTGAMTHGQAGRPAKLFQFRAQVMRERAFSGSKLPMAR